MRTTCIALAAVLGAAAQPALSQNAPQVGLIGMGLNVADMERSMKFYVEGLGMKALMRNERAETVEQFLGYPAMPYPPMLELIARKTPGAAPPPPGTTSFKIVLSVDNAEAIHAQLTSAGFSPPPVRMNRDAGGGAFFIRDPDGYNIEIVQRPPSPPRG
jgi:catechol 2,3-dioxygenase-like lactoylglutathione lyase family enzyme